MAGLEKETKILNQLKTWDSVIQYKFISIFAKYVC